MNPVSFMPYFHTVPNSMPMKPADRKAELVRRGVTLADIARALEVSGPHVSQVLYGKRRSPRVEQAIAEAIGKPVSRVFEASAA